MLVGKCNENAHLDYAREEAGYQADECTNTQYGKWQKL